VDAIMRGVQGAPEKAAIVRFGALSMRMGVAGIWVVPSGLDPIGDQRSKTGDRPVAILVKFHVPNTFRKPVRWTPLEQRGKVIEFHVAAKKAAWSKPRPLSLNRVSGLNLP
jgi:hypothetical protein